jgi:hypothetical protein
VDKGKNNSKAAEEFGRLLSQLLKRIFNLKIIYSLLAHHSLLLMGNAPITPRERQNLMSIPEEVGLSQDVRVSGMTRANSAHAIASELESTQDKTARYLPKRMNRSSNGVIMPSKPYGCGGASTVCSIEGPQCIESPQWGWYISISPPASDMYHCGSRTLHHKNQDSLTKSKPASLRTVASELSTVTSHQPNRIFKDMHSKRKDASMGWPSVPL